MGVAPPRRGEGVPGPRPGTTPEAVLAVARRTVLAGRPLEIGPLAREAGVGRSTVYRWFGDREALLARVLAGLVQDAGALVRAQVVGAGRLRLWRSVERFVEITLALEPFAAIVERETLVVVRLIMDPEGPVHRELMDLLLDQIRRDRPHGDLPAMEDRVLAAVIVQSTMVGLYARSVLGEAPDAERALAVARAVIMGGAVEGAGHGAVAGGGAA